MTGLIVIGSMVAGVVMFSLIHIAICADRVVRALDLLNEVLRGEKRA